MDRGLFIVVEGVEGAGKSTQARLLSLWMRAAGVPHLLTREPGGTPVGEAIRRIVLDRGDLTMPPETELFLILAARAAFVRNVVAPALERGEVVLADRFDFSTFAYQGYGRKLDLVEVRRANLLATAGARPDLTLVLDLPVEKGLERKGGAADGDRIEREGESFLQRVREGYLSLARNDDRALVLDAAGPPEEVQGALQRALVEAFPGTFSSEWVGTTRSQGLSENASRPS